MSLIAEIISRTVTVPFGHVNASMLLKEKFSDTFLIEHDANVRLKVVNIILHV